MRRSISSRILNGQDVCIFCAFRPISGATSRSGRTHRAIQEFSTSHIVSKPAGASAARKDDDDEDVPPMLRQNLGLASSFPSQRSKPVPPSPSRSDGSQQQSQATPPRSARSTEGPARHQQYQQPRQPQHDQPVFRNNFENFSRRNTQGQNRRTQQDGFSRNDARQNFRTDDRRQKFDTQSRRQESHGQSQEPQSGNKSFSIRRIGAFTADVPENNAIPPRPRFGKAEGSERFPRRPYNSSEASGQRNLPQETRPIFEDTSSKEPITWKPMQGLEEVDRFDRGRRGGSATEHNQSANPRTSEGSPEELATPTESTVPSVDTSYDERDILDPFHHRRGNREDKRKLRSERFEEMDEEGISTPAPAAASAPMRSYQGVKSGGRGRFDYDSIEAEEALYGDGGRRKKKGKSKKNQEIERARPSIKIQEFMSVGQLAQILNIQLEPFIEKLESEGFEGARYDHILDAESSSMFADLYGFEPVMATGQMAKDLVARPPAEDVSILPPRPPIVTIMGHVDHGKTTILDYLRKSSVVATEHGGITQHIGAFSVTMPGTNRQITFLDTPGHAAFLEMRRRGANVTDIVVLVVAADDSVKPQTIEAIKHAIDAKVQIIVAINKVDKQDANVERVKQDLTRQDIVVEDYGGEIQAIAVSGKTGQGMAELEEAIITLADVYDFRAETDGLAEGTIIESKVTAAGRVATVLVRRGTLRTGAFIVAGTTWARVRTLRDDSGVLVTEAPPGIPVQVDGWRGEDPTAGLEVLQAENEDQAKDVVDLRIEQRESMRASVDIAKINEARNEEAEARAKVLAWEAEQEWAKKSRGRRPKDNAGWVEPEAGSGPKQVHFVVKADVAGSVEAVVAAVMGVGNNEVVANVIHSGTGQVTESDIRMLSTTGETGYAISFNQPVDGTIYRLAEVAGLQILDHNIIYKVTDTVKEKLADHLPPTITQKVIGEAEVGQIFEITAKRNKVKIAGCKISNGTISRANKIRVLRNGSVIYTGTLHSLKNVKKDVTEMRKGSECGMGFEDWEDFQEGDQIQSFEETEEKRTLY